MVSVVVAPVFLAALVAGGGQGLRGSTTQELQKGFRSTPRIRSLSDGLILKSSPEAPRQRDGKSQGAAVPSQIQWASHPNKCLQVREDQKRDGLNVELADCNDTKQQQFVWTGTKAKIHWAAYPDLCFDIVDHYFTDNTPLQLWTCLEFNDDQLFNIPEDGQGKIRARTPSLCIDVAGHGTFNGNRIQLGQCNDDDDVQNFSAIPARNPVKLPEDWYKDLPKGADFHVPDSPDHPTVQCEVEAQLQGQIRWLHNTGKCLQVDDYVPRNNMTLELWDCCNASRQQFVWTGSMSRIYWAAHPHMCVEVYASKFENGTGLYLWPCHEESSQLFNIPEDGEGRITGKITSGLHSNMCVSVKNNEIHNKNPTWLWECIDGDQRQLFSGTPAKMNVMNASWDRDHPRGSDAYLAGADDHQKPAPAQVHCTPVFTVPDEARSGCLIATEVSLAVFVVLAAALLHILASRLSFAPDWKSVAELGAPPRRGLKLMGRPFCVEDTRLEEVEGADATRRRLILELAEPHRLRGRAGAAYDVEISGTGHPELDGRRRFRARPFGSRASALELLDESERPIEADWNASSGEVRMSAAIMLWRYGRAPALIPLSLLAALLACFWAFLYPRTAPASSFHLLVAVALILGVPTGTRAMTRWPSGRLEAALATYSVRLKESCPEPRQTARGPERAIKFGLFCDFLEFFSDFIQSRDMYYVQGHILDRLTAEDRLSFAEVAGACRAQWFVSHHWGTALRETCDALEQHAKAFREPGTHWRDGAYWICAFSINQYNKEEEVGTTWSESSFSLALSSGCLRGTVLVLDERALPLTRSWCLFEVLQTILLMGQPSTWVSDFATFEGLVLCSSSGVLNSDHANAGDDVALGIAQRLQTLSLQDAKASVPADKEMIDRLVVQEVGGLAQADAKLASSLSVALNLEEEATEEPAATTTSMRPSDAVVLTHSQARACGGVARPAAIANPATRPVIVAKDPDS